MNSRTRITPDKFSVKICTVAKSYGFKTIGSFYKFLSQCEPCAKLGLGNGYVRVSNVMKEVKEELNADILNDGNPIK